MATIRKLQAEIDKTFRKVDEQQEVFQQIFDRLKECDSSLKEKYEVLLFTDCIFHFVPPRNLYINCKIVSLIAFLFTRFKEEKREKKDSFQELFLHGERFVLLSFCALDMREERKGYIDMRLVYPQLLKIEFSSFLKEEQKPRFSSYFSTFG